MCIMAGPATVSSTSILIALSKDAETQDPSAVKRQLTVYEMTWGGIDGTDGKANALILAVPAKAEDVELVDLSGHPKIFGKLHELFHPQDAVMRGDHRLSFGDEVKPYIPVRKVGSYKVSVVPSFEDLDLVDPDLLVITAEAKKALAEYAGEFCFIVAVLQDHGKIHPLAYTHSVSKHGVFVPTKHEHGRRAPAHTGNTHVVFSSRGGGHEDGDGGLPKWDHSIYVIGKKVNRHVIFDADVAALSGLRLGKIPARWGLPPSAMPPAIMGEFLPANETVTLFTVDGAAPNHDLWL